jgi:uncharacterized protein
VIFIDTGAFIARFLTGDERHSVGSKLWKQMQESKDICITSNFVLDETLTYLARRSSYTFSAHVARHLFLSDTLVIVRPTPEDELEAVGFFEKYADQEVSFTDCISFALMRKRRIQNVFSFDRHFTLAGFNLWA